MSSRLWPHVEDEKLFAEIRSVLRMLDEITEDINIDRNVVDPFSAIFDMAKQNITYDEWIEQEKFRQAQKSLQNAVGYFHQNILGHVDGWVNPGSGGSFDLISNDKKIIAEIKNKHNTMNSTSGGGTYRKMANHLDGDYKGYMGYIVTVIHKSPQRISRPFAPSESGLKHEPRDDLLLVDGATFYHIVTGDQNALRELYQILPEAIKLALPTRNFDFNQETTSKSLLELFDRAFGD